MKAYKRITALALSLVLAFSCLWIIGSAFSSDSAEAMNLLVLGDSIAQGFGVKNSDEASYARIVADTNGYNYRNFARSAHDTQDLIREITQEEIIVDSVREADIINISTGSNNYLANPDVVAITAGALFGVNDKTLDKIAEKIFEDYLLIYDIIRELNPDATIIMNNVYCSWEGLGYIPFIKASNRVNEKIKMFQNEHPDVIIFDIDSVITGKKELIADDCVHPNAEGNVRIAKAFLLLLKENGLGENTEPVILHEGINYSYFVEEFGKLGGKIIEFIVKIITVNL